MESQELKDFEEKIKSNSADIKPIDGVKFLQDHKDETEAFAKFLFYITDKCFDYHVNKLKKEMIGEIIVSLPDLHERFLKPIFTVPDDTMRNDLYRIKDFSDTIKFYFLTEYTDSQLIKTVVNVICPPYNFFTKYFIKDDNSLHPFMRPLIPEVYQEIDDEMARLNQIVETFKKVCFVPKVSRSDSVNPRISKFGGMAPYLPKKGPKICECGNDKLQTVFSLYIPSIPEEMKKLFPQDHEYVLVGYTCNTCYLKQYVQLYVDDEIDQLVYDDVPSKDDIFNEPRTVIGWSENYMFPSGLDESGFELPDRDSYKADALYFIEEIFEKKRKQNNELLTYLGGYPCFVQGDDRPKGHMLLLEMEESEASTNMWGDCGTAQVWMTTGEDFGSFVMQYSCC